MFARSSNRLLLGLTLLLNLSLPIAFAGDSEKTRDPSIKGYYITTKGVVFYVNRSCPDFVKKDYIATHKATRSIPPTIIIDLQLKTGGTQADCMKLVPTAQPLVFTWKEMGIDFKGRANITVSNKLYPDTIEINP